MEVPDGTRIRTTPDGSQYPILPGLGSLPALCFLSSPRYAKWVKVLSEEPLAEEIPDYHEGDTRFPWSVP